LLVDNNINIFNFQKKTQYCKQNSKEFKLHICERIEEWYWKEEDGRLKRYKDADIKEFHTMQHSTTTMVTSIMVGSRYRYEIDLKRKIQRNSETGTERSIFNEDDYRYILSWEDFSFDYTKFDLNSIFNMVLQRDSLEFKKVSDIFRVSIPNKRKSIRALVGFSKWAGINEITKITKIVNPKLRSLWQVQLENAKQSSDFHIEFLFYAPSNYSRTNFHGKWEYNNPGLNAFVFSQNASHFIRDHRTKKIVLAEVIISNEIFCENPEKIKEEWMQSHSLTTWNQTSKSWCWYITNGVCAYPTYIIEFSS